MSIKLKVASVANGHDISAQITLPTDSMTFTMTPLGARQLGEHLTRLANMIEDAAL